MSHDVEINEGELKEVDWFEGKLPAVRHGLFHISAR